MYVIWVADSRTAMSTDLAEAVSLANRIAMKERVTAVLTKETRSESRYVLTIGG